MTLRATEHLINCIEQGVRAAGGWAEVDAKIARSTCFNITAGKRVREESIEALCRALCIPITKVLVEVQESPTNGEKQVAMYDAAQ